MRTFTLSALLALTGLALTGDPAEAQFRRYRNFTRYQSPSTYYSYYPGSYRYYSSPYSYPGYSGGWSSSYYSGVYGSPWTSSYSGYSSPYVYPPSYGGYPYDTGYAGGYEAEFIRSLYHQYLGREPDPQGIQTWLARLAQYNGDRSRVVNEFLVAAQRERLSNTPGYPYGGWYR